MAVNFQLIHRHYPDGPVSLNGVDEAICQYLGVPVHATRYRSWWFDVIGFRLACGKTWEQVRHHIVSLLRDGDTEEERAHVGELLLIAQYLDDNYVPYGFTTIGRR